MNQFLVENEVAFWRISTTLGGVLAMLLWRRGLATRYKAFVWYLTIRVSASLMMMLVPRNTNTYALLYALLLPVTWALSLWLVLSIVQDYLEAYPGLARLSRRLLTGSFVFATCVAVALNLVERKSAAEAYPMLRSAFEADKTVSTTLLLFLLTVTAFAAWFPVPMRRNVLVIQLGFCLMLLMKSLVMYTRILAGHQWTRPLSAFAMFFDVFILLGWIVLLAPKGETLAARMPEVPPNKLLGQLRGLNARLEGRTGDRISPGSDIG